jgi:hypothetical protein
MEEVKKALSDKDIAFTQPKNWNSIAEIYKRGDDHATIIKLVCCGENTL